MGFEQTVMYFGGPALCGLKSASLVSVPVAKYSAEKTDCWNNALAECGRRIVAVRRSESLILLFIYDREVLYHALGGRRQMRYLHHKGYPVEKGFDAVLGELFQRLSCQESFPHEVGLFLGYPFEDVINFERYGGKNSRYSGMWQVYGNVEEACRLMESYRRCSVLCDRYFCMGKDVPFLSRHVHVEQ